MTVVILEDAAEDIEAGRHFYESREAGIGEYFVESILSDLGSLVLYAGIHPTHFGFQRMLSKRFPFGVYYEVEGETAMFMRSWTCGAIRSGFEASCARGDSELAACTGLRGHVVLHARRQVRGASEADRSACNFNKTRQNLTNHEKTNHY